MKPYLFSQIKILHPLDTRFRILNFYDKILIKYSIFKGRFQGLL